MKCPTCKGHKLVEVKMLDRSGRNQGFPEIGTVVCPGCVGKGYIDETDRNRIQSIEQYEQIVRQSWQITPE